MRRCTVGWAVHTAFSEILEDCHPSCSTPELCPQNQLQEELKDTLQEKERLDYMLKMASEKVKKLQKDNESLIRRLSALELAMAQAYTKLRKKE